MNEPGAMAMLVAPVVAQVRVLLAPEFMPVGFAVKEPIVGTEPCLGDEVDVPQFRRPAQVRMIRISA